MPNIKSAKKRVIVAETRRARNMAAKAAMKTQLKKVLPLLWKMAISQLLNVNCSPQSAFSIKQLAKALFIKMPPQDGNPIFIGIIIICNLLTPLFSSGVFFLKVMIEDASA